MFTDQRHLRSADIGRWRESFVGATPIQALRWHRQAICVGVVVRIRLSHGESVEVTIVDGTGRLTATFPAGSPLPGVQLGHGLLVCGTATPRDADDLVMEEPAWLAISR